MNGLKGIIKEELDIDYKWYWVDVGEECEVNIKYMHLSKCGADEAKYIENFKYRVV